MPSASQEMHDKMQEYFGDPISDEGPTQYLVSQGYKLNKNWTWTKAGINALVDMTQKEFDCLRFLIEEWDFGGLQ